MVRLEDAPRPDSENALKAARQYNDDIALSKDEQVFLRLSLFRSAISSYGKCFAESGKGGSSLNKKEVFKGHDELRVVHERMIEVRNSFAAHNGDNDLDTSTVAVCETQHEIRVKHLYTVAHPLNEYDDFFKQCVITHCQNYSIQPSINTWIVFRKRPESQSHSDDHHKEQIIPMASSLIYLPSAEPRSAPASLPAIITASGPAAPERFLEFFAANIRNPNTRRAYARQVMQFLFWCEGRSVTSLRDVRPLHVAGYIETMPAQAQTVKQALAAIRMLFDWLVIGQIVPTNPAGSVRGPKYSYRRGKTPVLSREDARALLDSIDAATLIGLRDRALIGLMVFSFARIGAVLGMQVNDYYQNGRRSWIRLHEKGGKFHVVPVHHNADDYLHAYIEAAGIASEGKQPLWRTGQGRTGRLTGNALQPREALFMIKRRAKTAGLPENICNHTFRATGITAYLENGGTIENAQAIAAHESPRTTKLYDRRNDQISLDEIERIVI